MFKIFSSTAGGFSSGLGLSKIDLFDSADVVDITQLGNVFTHTVACKYEV